MWVRGDGTSSSIHFHPCESNADSLEGERVSWRETAFLKGRGGNFTVRRQKCFLRHQKLFFPICLFFLWSGEPLGMESLFTVLSSQAIPKGVWFAECSTAGR